MGAPRVIYQYSGTGPVHLAQESGTLSWCGMKPQFKHVSREGSQDEVTCTKCLRQIERDQPLAWGAR